MADTGGDGIAHAGAVSFAVYTTGGAGNVVFGGIRKDGEFFHEGKILLNVHSG